VVHRELNPSENTRLPKAGWVQIGNWLLGRFKRFRVAGLSMEPTLGEGQTVLVNPKAYSSKAPQLGQIVLVQLPSTENPCIKRIASISDQGLDLRGDNPNHSTDSRHLGSIPMENLRGQVLCSLP
jgi:nickel-type superoxide dismutase maturation protease